MIQFVRQAIATNGGTPRSWLLPIAWRELVTVYGGTPTKWEVNALIRQAITAVGGTPTKWGEVALLHELLAALGAPSMSYNLRKLYQKLGVTVKGGGLVTRPDQTNYTQPGSEYLAYANASSTYEDPSLEHLVDYEDVITVNPATFPNGTEFAWRWPTGPCPSAIKVWGYNALQHGNYGGGLPAVGVTARQIKNIGRCRAEIVYTYRGSTKFNLLFECFLNSVAPENSQTTHLHEIGWFAHAPAATVNFHKSGTSLGTITVSGVVWTMWNHGNYTTLYPQDEVERLSFVPDMKAVWDRLIAFGYLTGEEWYVGSAVGGEVVEELDTTNPFHSGVLRIVSRTDTYDIVEENPGDTTPLLFTFPAQTGVAPATLVTSASRTMVMTAAAPITMTSGAYSINGATFTSAPGTVQPYDRVRVRATSSANGSTTTSAIGSVGGVPFQFDVTTVAGAVTPRTGGLYNTVGLGGWTGGAATVSANSRPLPGGGANTAGRITENGAFAIHLANWKVAGPLAAGVHTYDCFVKRGAGARNVGLAYWRFQRSQLAGFVFNLSGTPAPYFSYGGLSATASVEPFLDFFKISMTFTEPIAQTAFELDVQMFADYEGTYAGDGSSSLDIWDLQLV
jgi:hypothetical protein